MYFQREKLNDLVNLPHLSHTVDCINSDKSLYDDLDFDLNQITSSILGATVLLTHCLQCIQKSKIFLVRLNSPMSLTCALFCIQSPWRRMQLDHIDWIYLFYCGDLRAFLINTVSSGTSCRRCYIKEFNSSNSNNTSQLWAYGFIVSCESGFTPSPRC